MLRTAVWAPRSGVLGRDVDVDADGDRSVSVGSAVAWREVLDVLVDRDRTAAPTDHGPDSSGTRTTD
jgi:hypothetical protein